MESAKSLGKSLPKTMNRERADEPLRILFLYSRVPFPMMRGDQLTVAHLLSYLSARGHSVDFVTTDADGHMSSHQRDWLYANCREVHLEKQSYFAKGCGLIASIVRLEPMQVGIFRNRKINKLTAQRVASGEYDLIYCYYLRSATAVPAIFSPMEVVEKKGNRIVAFLAMQLSQTLNTRRIFHNSTSGVKKIVYFFETWLMERFEARIWQRFTKVVLIGQKDVEAIEEACLRQTQPKIDNWVYGAHGTDVEAFKKFSPSEVVENRVLFSGSMLYQPNVQAALWFYKNCWPALRKMKPNLEWYIVGRDPVSEILDLDGRDGITVTGSVPDIGSEIRKAAVCINPVLAAGGMQNKLIEYMASGKPIVATSVSNEGINGVDGEALVIADNPETFIKATSELLDDPTRAALLGDSARAFVLENWTWEAHFDKLESEFYQALKTKFC